MKLSVSFMEIIGRGSMLFYGIFLLALLCQGNFMPSQSTGYIGTFQYLILMHSLKYITPISPNPRQY
jgi:hypothetical protein